MSPTGIIVVAEHEGIGHEAQGFGFEVPETLQQIARFGLGGAAALAIVGGPGAFQFAAAEDLAVAAAEGVGGGFAEACAGFEGADVDFEQERVHVEGPALVVVDPGAFEFAQVMGVAQAMQAGELEVGLQMVVAQPAVKVGQNADGVHGRGAAFGMGNQQRPPVVGQVVQPMECLANLDAGFVGVQNRLLL